VAWAMLVARVCQLYPKATSSTVVLKFFRIMEKWQWPTPVLLKTPQLQPKGGGSNVRVWNPKVSCSLLAIRIQLTVSGLPW
jgi:poly(A) polymerase